MLIKTEYFKRFVIFAVAIVMALSCMHTGGMETLKNSEAVFYFTAAYSPEVEIFSANRQALKGTSNKTNNAVWISEKPDNFENRFLFNISCFKMSTVFIAENVSPIATESKKSYIKKPFYIRI